MEWHVTALSFNFALNTYLVTKIATFEILSSVSTLMCESL